MTDVNDGPDPLRDAARAMGQRLAEEHLAPETRPRVRAAVPLAGLLLVLCALGAWRHGSSGGQDTPPDPVAAIAAEYADTARLEALLQPDHWTDEQRETFRRALKEIDASIALVSDALRKEPGAAELAELCHLAYRARRRLVTTYHDRLGGER